MRKRCWKALPHVAAQSVAAAQPEAVIGLAWVRRARAAGTGTTRRCTGTACSPSRRCRSQNRLAENRRPMTTDPPPTRTAPAASTPPDAVIHRQAVVHAVARADVHQAGEPVRPLHQPRVADAGGLGQAGGAGGVDVERAIVDRHRPSPDRFGGAGRGLEVILDPRKPSRGGVAVTPDPRGRRRDRAAPRPRDRSAPRRRSRAWPPQG